jgi:hypothetical protein
VQVQLPEPSSELLVIATAQALPDSCLHRRAELPEPRLNAFPGLLHLGPRRAIQDVPVGLAVIGRALVCPNYVVEDHSARVFQEATIMPRGFRPG